MFILFKKGVGWSLRINLQFVFLIISLIRFEGKLISKKKYGRPILRHARNDKIVFKFWKFKDLIPYC